MSKPTNSITIVIPAYNEEENIKWVTEDVLKSLPKYFKKYEVIIVDDGSSDSTGQISDSIARNNKFVKVLHQPNGGYSRAMLTGIKAAQKELVAYMPADGQFLVDDMRHCFEKTNQNDLVLGYRGSRLDYATKRIIYSYGYLLLLLFLFGIKYIDVGWVNIWKTKKVQGLVLNDAAGIFILTEILVKFQQKGYKIDEAPSYYRSRKSGKVKNAKMNVIINTFLEALKLKWKIITSQV